MNTSYYKDFVSHDEMRLEKKQLFEEEIIEEMFAPDFKAEILKTGKSNFTENLNTQNKESNVTEKNQKVGYQPHTS